MILQGVQVIRSCELSFGSPGILPFSPSPSAPAGCYAQYTLEPSSRRTGCPQLLPWQPVPAPPRFHPQRTGGFGEAACWEEKSAGGAEREDQEREGEEGGTEEGEEEGGRGRGGKERQGKGRREGIIVGLFPR